MSNVMPAVLPVAGAVTGWIVNEILVRSLLKKAVKRQPQIADTLGTMAAGLIDTDKLVEKLKDPANLVSIKPVIEAHVQTFLQVKLKEKMPAIAMFVGGSTLDKLRDGLLEEIDILLPDVIAGYADKMTRDLQIRQLVSDKIAALPEEKITSLLHQSLGKELRLLKTGGAITGFITGLLAVLAAL